jgi:hypothetical protein
MSLPHGIEREHPIGHIAHAFHEGRFMWKKCEEVAAAGYEGFALTYLPQRRGVKARVLPKAG